MDTSADAEPVESLKQYKLLMFIVRWMGWWPVVGKIVPLFFGKKFLSDPSRQNEVREWKARIRSSNGKAMREILGIAEKSMPLALVCVGKPASSIPLVPRKEVTVRYIR